jgi:hypothetical protein
MKKLLVLIFPLLLAACGGGANASGVSQPSNYQPNNVAITGGTISTVNAFSMTNIGIGVGGTIQANGLTLFRATAPTIASGFGTSPFMGVSNGTAMFLVGVGTGGTASQGVMTMPAATNGWSCVPSYYGSQPINTHTTSVLYMAANTSTSITIASYNETTGLPSPLVAGAGINVTCVGY